MFQSTRLREARQRGTMIDDCFQVFQSTRLREARPTQLKQALLF